MVKFNLNLAAALIIGIIVLVAAGSFFFFQKGSPKNGVPSKESQKLEDANNANSQRKKGEIEAEIVVKSVIPNYTVVLLSEDKLRKLLIGWNIFGTAYKVKYGSSDIDVKKLTITLTDQPQKLFPIRNAEKKDLGSIDVVVTDGEINIPIYLSPLGLTNANQYFESEALLALYSIKYNVNETNSKQFLDAFGKIWKDKEAKNERYFEVSKK